MTLDWMRVRLDLHEDPAVLSIAAELGFRPETVVGYCVRFWAWASRNMSQDERDISGTCVPQGSVIGPSVKLIEQVLNLPGFLQLLEKVGWLEITETEHGTMITIPKFDRWLSEGSKQRALATERKRNQRANESPNGHGDVTNMSRNGRDKCPSGNRTRGEERRVEENNRKTPLNPPKGKRGRKSKYDYSDEFEEFWESYSRIRRTEKADAFQAWPAAVAGVSEKLLDPNEVKTIGKKKAAVKYLVQRAKDYAESPQGKCKFCRGPVRFLKKGMWEDLPEAWARGDDSDPAEESQPDALDLWMKQGKEAG